MKKDKKTNELKGYKGLRQTFRYYKRYKGLVTAFILLSIIGMLPTIFIPIFEGNMMGYFTEFVIGGENFKAILICAGLVLGSGLLNLMINFILNLISVRLSKKIQVDIQKELLDEISTLEVGNYDKTSTGVFISRINEDVNEMSNFLIHFVDDFLSLMASVFVLCYIAFINIYVFAFLIAQLLIIYFAQYQRAKVWYRRRKEWKANNEEIIGIRSEAVRGARDLKGLNLARAFNGMAIKKQIRLSDLDAKNQIVDQVWMRVVRAISIMFKFLYIVLSVFLLMYSDFTIAAFFIILNYHGKINSMIDIITELKQESARAEFSSQRVFELMHNHPDFPHEKFGNVYLPNVDGEIHFNHVRFAYGENSPEIFHDLSLTIQPNRITAFVGKSGGGKSSILSLIERFYPLQSGQILLDNVSINDLTKDCLRDNISLVLQAPYIFNMSVKENLLLVKPDATDAEIKEVCKKADLSDFIEKLPNQYDSMVGENGIVLSGGQKQRLAIARALLKNSKIILFDEATSALDNKSQGKIKKVLDELSKDHTVVVVAHRLSTVVDAGEIFVIGEHGLLGQGKHEILMQNCSEYRDLYLSESDAAQDPNLLPSSE